MTRVPELRRHGITVAFGHDCVMDPWYSLGQADMLEVATMGLHVGQMTSRDDMRFCFEAVTEAIRRRSCISTATASPSATMPTWCSSRRADPIEAIRLKAHAARRDPARQGDRRDAGAGGGARPAGPAGQDRSRRLRAEGRRLVELLISLEPDDAPFRDFLAQLSQ